MTINKETVAKVYSGKSGCMCGCRGTYKVALLYKELAGVDRGYTFKDEDVSDRSVSFVVNKLNSFPGVIEWAEDGQYAYMEHNGRVYCAYFADHMVKELTDKQVREAMELSVF